jgi:hypothetical protein
MINELFNSIKMGNIFIRRKTIGYKRKDLLHDLIWICMGGNFNIKTVCLEQHECTF